VRSARVFLAGVFVGASVAGAVWLYTYRAHEVIRFIDKNGIEYNDPRPVSVQPWWGVYAALGLLAVAVAVAIRLVPNGVPMMNRLSHRVSSSRPDEPRSRNVHP
jgi:hypothetical protein